MGIVVSTSAFGAVEAKPSKPAPVAAEKKAVSDKVSREVYTNYAKNADDREILTEAWGLYVDDVFLGACLDEDELRAELQKVLDDYKAAYDDETTDEFANNVNVELGSFRGLQIGDAQSIVQNNLDKFSISLSTDLEYTEDIPYETIVEYDDTQYTDYREVTQKGITGKKKTIIRATYVDGVETDTEVTDVITVKEKQDKYVVKGTLEYAEEEESEDEIYDDSASSDGSSTGSFIWPMPYTTNITSGYGARWGTTHTGIDIAEGGIYGQSIIASDGGVVEWAGSDDSGYGTYVIINHQNGYKTLYGHCSELFVSEGQYVSQGEAIAAVGSTGFSTGPHLHFEVRTEDGDRLDPQDFV
jgi:murein DD-endopeptidase MepM/ murein hydrolase activator NlpD